MKITGSQAEAISLLYSGPGPFEIEETSLALAWSPDPIRVRAEGSAVSFIIRPSGESTRYDDLEGFGETVTLEALRLG